MKIRGVLAICCLLALAAVSSTAGAEEFLLYTPKPAAAGQAPVAPDQGVLVKTVTVRRGDTLRKLSREHVGVASWFPQVLLFNTIKNPDLIHTGDKLLVPVRAGHVTRAQGAGKGKKSHASRLPSSRVKPVAARRAGGMHAVRQGEQESFQRAEKAYLDGDYQKALEMYSRFLHKFPRSRFAAEASLHRADCFMRLSGE